MPKAKKFDVVADINKLTKEEIIQLIRDNWSLYFSVKRRDILLAKANICQQRADAAFELYEKYPIPNHEDGIMEWYGAHKEKEKHLKAYQRLWNKYEKLHKEALNAD